MQRLNHSMLKFMLTLNKYRVSRRTFASDGYLGYWGNWRHHSGERYTFYLTNRTKNVFLLHSKHGGRSVAINLPKEWVK